MNERILILDDEASILEILGEHLTDDGYECVGTVSPLDALERIKGGGFAVLLTDLKMPEMHGIEVVRRAKDRLIVYWLTSPEPDVARYHIYRGQEKNFSITGKSPLVTLASVRFFLQTFADNGLEPGRTYYYKVVAEDWAGNRQTASPVAEATTPAY